MRTWQAWGVAGATALGLFLSPAWTPSAFASVVLTGPEDRVAINAWSHDVWSAATAGGERELLPALLKMPAATADAAGRLGSVRASVDSLRANIEKREKDRATRTTEVEGELDKALASLDTDLAVSKALRSAIELEMLLSDREKFLAQDRIKQLLERGTSASRAAEKRGDWLVANELYLRLDALLEEHAEFREAADRQARRLQMIRMYAPERFWELRNERQKAEKGEGLPRYNPAKDDFHEKLALVDSAMVVKAVDLAAKRHVSRPGHKSVLLAGLEALRTMVTTSDLKAAFPKLGDATAVDAFSRRLDQFSASVSGTTRRFDIGDLMRLIGELEEANESTINIPEQALYHEFGNGAISELDEFTAIIWPDELARFTRQTESSFPGVGIRIEYDELMNVRIVTPLEGMPAHRAGIQAGDVIKAVNGESIYGATLDQAVELITGPVNTSVTLSVERENENKEKVSRDYLLKRSRIQVKSVMGWKRNGPREDDWDWFIDPDNKIAYVRMSQFTDTTDHEFDAAVRKLKAGGAEGLIFDLRFNPGGYLDQAVTICSRFIERGQVVGMKGASGQMEEWHTVNNEATLADLPVAVLINEGSASASEIVSGAIRHYAHEGKIHAAIVGQRSYGKGSVQVVSALAGNNARMKLTAQYYTMPDETVIHRMPHAKTWGVEPDLVVDMLPSQVSKSLDIRKAADIIPTDADGNIIPGAKTEDPAKLLTDGVDVQLQAALVLLQTQSLTAPAPVGTPRQVQR
jgi:carboxyl-terminal processing protease